MGHHVRRASSAALILLTNVHCFPDQLRKGIYLTQMYTLEHFDYLTQTSLKRIFLHFTAERPLTIHLVPWLIAWMFELGCIVFFIFWILKWGDTATIETVASWSTNFILSLAQEIFIVSVIRILAINVLVIEWARPSLRRIHGHLTTFVEERNLVVVNDDDSHIIQHISPSLIASKHESMRPVPVASLLLQTTDFFRSI